MEGFGVTNYALGRPSYAFSAETTEFDNALIRHGVVTKEQAIMSKGATLEQAQQLVQQSKLCKEEKEIPHWNHQNEQQEKQDDSDDDSYLDDDDNDDFMKQYRLQRIQEMQQQAIHHHRFGPVHHISRAEWQQYVNEASHGAWVIVCLTCNHNNDDDSNNSNNINKRRTAFIELAIHEMAQKQYHRHHHQHGCDTPATSAVRFVTIEYQEAFGDSSRYPLDKLPTLFAYRHGTLQHAWTNLPVSQTSARQLEMLLQNNCEGIHFGTI